ncbi:hypothetical protein [uncultured Methylobacterium sp.]|uniref:hypothetical protein n=1 Tax=uncultured Methylobacterium sp. TaxID=157278 RepID=UPI0035CAAD27
MSMALAMPLVEATVFTGGCAVIHALRRHADRVTMVLAGLTVLLVLLVGIGCTPDSFLTAQAGGLIEETGAVQPID